MEIQVQKVIKDIINKHGKTADMLLPILLELQEQNPVNYLLENDIRYIAHELNIPESRVYSVATFYSFFSLEKRGKVVIQVCNNPSCLSNNSKQIAEYLKKLLKIDFRQTTADELYTLEYTNCLGHCYESPAICINGEIYGNIDEEQINKLLKKHREEVKC